MQYICEQPQIDTGATFDINGAFLQYGRVTHKKKDFPRSTDKLQI